ncbi:GNAT family protein [Jeongeupia wiesaeckerbachi]|uniref:GNAT family N-acetyltransferase n=1 Tax=Jeongeupia wiesaeckerbachi TaxID=3051218 RepID=UPI003D808CAC
MVPAAHAAGSKYRAQLYPQLDTPRLSLDAFTDIDAPRVQVLAGVFEVADTTASIPHPYPDGAAAAWIAQQQPFWAAGLALTLAIRRRDNGLLIGAIGLQALDTAPEFGFWLGQAYWGHGYASEAALAVRDFAFGTLAVRCLAGRHLARNPASGRVQQKIGMRRVGCTQAAVRDGRIETVVEYALRADEWQAAAVAGQTGP